MIVEFTITAYAKTPDEVAEEMDDLTSVFLKAAGGKFWECTEDIFIPDPRWVPGFGPVGKKRGYKAHRKFVNRNDQQGR